MLKGFHTKVGKDVSSENKKQTFMMRWRSAFVTINATVKPQHDSTHIMPCLRIKQ